MAQPPLEELMALPTTGGGTKGTDGTTTTTRGTDGTITNEANARR